MRFLRTIRLDHSDLQVFPLAAAPGEWAVPGSFAFAQGNPEALAGKDKQAFRNGWLGTESFGRATLVEVAEIDEAGFFQVVERLAQHFVEVYGAPSLTAALPAARAEADYAHGLSDQKLHSLLAIERELGGAGVTERVGVIRPQRASDHARIWEIESE